MLDPKTFHEIISGRRRSFGAKLTRAGLRLASYPYAAGVYVRNRRFDTSHTSVHRVSVPVISVGNLTLGGTGKTPMIAWLSKWLRRQNRRPAIVSRGYKADSGSRNDEALELEHQLPDVPHLQNPDRVAAAQVAIQELECDLILLDDGFQHRRLHRDFDIVLLDATCPFGHERLFPRGTLREPIRALRRAQAVVLTRADLVSAEQRSWIQRRVTKIAPHVSFSMTRHAPTMLVSHSGQGHPITALEGKTISAFCGIGNPAGFRGTLSQLKDVTLDDFREFPDHHPYQEHDIRSLDEIARNSKCEAVLCTRKDLVKVGCDQIGGKALWAVGIEMEFLEGETKLCEQLKISAASRMPRE